MTHFGVCVLCSVVECSEEQFQDGRLVGSDILGQHALQTGVDQVAPAQHTILHQAGNSRTTPTATELQCCPPTHPSPPRLPSLHPPALCTPVAVPATSPVEGQALPAAHWRGTQLDGFPLTPHPSPSPTPCTMVPTGYSSAALEDQSGAG